MQKYNYDINIFDGKGKKRVFDGDYDVSAKVPGYNDSTITPVTVSVSADVAVYDFKIASTGGLTLHVTEDGTPSGVPVSGATFIRCDSDGNEYGDVITTDKRGFAVFSNVPFSPKHRVDIYYKQKSSDSEHSFDGSLKSYSLKKPLGVVDVINTPARESKFTLTDLNYANLPIKFGTISLSEQ